MARKRPQRDPTRLAFAADALLEHLLGMTREIDGVRVADDIEYVHRMRVASRRMRNALSLFGDLLPGKRTEQWPKAIKRVTKSLGAARDADVQVDFLQRFFVDAKADGRLQKQHEPGLNRLLLRLRQHREKQQPQVLRAMDELEHEVAPAMERWLHEVRTATLDTPRVSASLRREASERVLQRTQEVLAFEPYVRQPEHSERLHEMRVACKHLRYTLEAFAPQFDRGIKTKIKWVKQMQSTLGDLHDSDVWIDFLPQFLADEEQRFRGFLGHTRGFKRLIPGIEFLRAHLERQRAAIYASFVEMWEHDADREAWRRFRGFFEKPS